MHMLCNDLEGIQFKLYSSITILLIMEAVIPSANNAPWGLSKITVYTNTLVVAGAEFVSNLRNGDH